MKVSKERFRQIQDFVYDHQKEILNLAIQNTTSISDAVVWLDNISEGELKLSAGTYTTGTTENPANIEDSIAVYSLKRNWWSENFDEDLCWKRDEDGNIFRNSNHIDYDKNRTTPLTEKEQWEDLKLCLEQFFYENFDEEVIANLFYELEKEEEKNETYI